jgi:hypothetical protein
MIGAGQPHLYLDAQALGLGRAQVRAARQGHELAKQLPLVLTEAWAGHDTGELSALAAWRLNLTRRREWRKSDRSTVATVGGQELHARILSHNP